MDKDCLNLIGKWELPFQTKKVNLLSNYMEFGGGLISVELWA